MDAARDTPELVEQGICPGVEIVEVDGMIIDLRYNMGGNNAIVKSIVSCLVDHEVTSPIMRFRHFIGAYEAWGKEPVWETASDQIRPRGAGRATLVGQKTGGSAGNGLISALPGGGTLKVSTFTALIPGGEEYVGVGVTPDVEVIPTREDLIMGRAPVLGRAKALLTD